MGLHSAHFNTWKYVTGVYSMIRGHRPKVLLWIMEEFFYISYELTDQDCDGHVILSYELMIEAEH